MKVISVRTQGGMEFVGRIDSDILPVKTENGWSVPSLIDPSRSTPLTALTLQKPIELMRIPVSGRDRGGPPQIMPAASPVLCTANVTLETLTLLPNEILMLVETDAEFADFYIKDTSEIDLSGVQKPGIQLVR